MFKQTGRLKPFQTACGLVGFTTQPTRRRSDSCIRHLAIGQSPVCALFYEQVSD